MIFSVFCWARARSGNRNAGPSAPAASAPPPASFENCRLVRPLASFLFDMVPLLRPSGLFQLPEVDRCDEVMGVWTDEIISQLSRSTGRRAVSMSGMHRQPVHTFYEGAHLFRVNAAKELGAAALAALEEHAPTAGAFATALGLAPSPRFEEIHERVLGRLREDPVEDYRIDFEDGYGARPDEEEDAAAATSAHAAAAAHAAGSLPPFYGIRIKSLE